LEGKVFKKYNTFMWGNFEKSYDISN